MDLLSQATPFQHPEPGPQQPSRPRRPLLWVITLLLIAAAVVLQHTGGTDDDWVEQAHKGLKATPPDDPFLMLFGKLVLGVKRTWPMDTAFVLPNVDTQVGWKPEKKPASIFDPPDLTRVVSVKNDQSPASDRLRAAILAAEALGPLALRSRLEDLEKHLDPESELREDCEVLAFLYPDPDGDPAPQPSAESRDRFEKRHGWFARIALSNGDDAAPVRKEAAADFSAIIIFLVLFGAVVSLALIAGVVLLILAIIAIAQGRVRPGFVREPLPVVGSERLSHVWLETLAVFLALFLAMHLLHMGADALAGDKAHWPEWIALGGPWLLIPCICWPVARGMSWERWRAEIGWHKGRGIGREIGAGLVAYFTALPVFIAYAVGIVLVTLVVRALLGGEESPPPTDSRVFDIMVSGSIPMILALVLLATVWAPIVEESIFRGALYRQLRSRAPIAVAVLVSAAVFAMIHPYPLIGVFVVGGLGMSFALMREWRNCLIPSAVAHGLHNSTSLLLTITLFRVLAHP